MLSVSGFLNLSVNRSFKFMMDLGSSKYNTSNKRNICDINHNRCKKYDLITPKCMKITSTVQ